MVYRCAECQALNNVPRRQTRKPRGWQRHEQPHIDGWRLFVEIHGELYSPGRGIKIHPGCTAVCRYDSTHHSGCDPDCWCGYYAVTRGGHRDAAGWFAGSGAMEHSYNGLLLSWPHKIPGVKRADVFPVFAGVRLHNPFTYAIRDDWDTYKNGTVWRGGDFDLIGPILTVHESSAERMRRWVEDPQVVEDLPSAAIGLVGRAL